jgi:flagellar motor switch/type III secretory pathway protein FliN
LQSLVARWVSARTSSLSRLERLVGPVRVTLAGAPLASAPLAGAPLAGAPLDDPHAAHCMIRVAGAALEARASSGGIKRIAQALLGGPAELPAPRPLTFAESAVWCSLVEAALEDLAIVAQIWPSTAPSISTRATSTGATSTGATSTGATSTGATSRSAIHFDITLGDIPLAVSLYIPAGLDLRVPPALAPPKWSERMHVDATVVVGRGALHREDLARLRARSLVTIDRALELEVLGGTLGLRAEPRAVVAEVVTGYVRRPMSLPDNAHVELTVALGTTQLSLRQVAELSIGQIISLGRPLAGPFELRAAGRLVGKGELVDVDGELAVRIVSVGDQE